MSKATTTVEGFVSKDPEVKDVNGSRVVEVTVPHTPRRQNKQTREWEDAGDTQWYVASFWNEEGDAILNAVRKGVLVTVTGQPEYRAFVKNDGTAGIGLGLKFATLGIIPRPQSNSGGNFGNGAANSFTPAPQQQQFNAPNNQGWPGSVQQGTPTTDSWAAAKPYGDDTPF